MPSPSSADIGFAATGVRAEASIQQSSPGGCRSGFTFQADWDGCVRTSSTSGSESRACPSGQTGTQRRTRSRTVYTHQNGSIANGPWSAWSSWSGTCTAVPPPAPPPPTVGTELTIPSSISAMICGPGDAGYGSGGNTLIENSYRNQLIAYYRAFGLAGRCPETSGYNWWLSDWWSRASKIANGPFHAPGGNPRGLGWGAYVNTFMPDAWEEITRAIDVSAAGNDEANQGGVLAANGLCQRAANLQFGSGKTTAIYILKSGNRCRVTAVH